MYSVNAPVPGRVRRLAAELQPALLGFDRIREDHSLLVKRLGRPDSYPACEKRGRSALRGAPAVEARVTGVDYFAEPTAGPGPVVYLAVESPGLRRLHERLVAEFGAEPDLEGVAYVPHVTLARGGEVAAAERLAEREIEPVAWTVSELTFRNHEYGTAVATVSLPS